MHLGPAIAGIRPLRLGLFPSLAGLGDAGHVALTLDDGPDPVATPRFLDELARLDVRATFFVLGSRLQKHRWIGREMVAAGHEVGVHGWRHWPAGLSARALARTAALIADVTGVAARWYRPPHGILTAPALRACYLAGLTPVLWSVSGRDWRHSCTPDSTLWTVESGIVGGATVALNDGSAYESAWRATLDALPAIVALAEGRGLKVGPLGEHGSSLRGSLEGTRLSMSRAGRPPGERGW